MEISGCEFSVSKVLYDTFLFLNRHIVFFENQHKHSVQFLGLSLGVIRLFFFLITALSADIKKDITREKITAMQKTLFQILRPGSKTSL